MRLTDDDDAVQLKQGVFSPELLLDMVVYGLWMSALCLSSFTLVLYGFGRGAADIGDNCNEEYSEGCEVVFRARATTFACLTWFALFLAWEMVSMRRSLFRMQPKSKRYLTQWMLDVWRNQFLFWAVVAGFVTMFPVLYIPTLNTVVFKHAGISWEWGIVFVESILFFLGIEAWKWAKRVYLRHGGGKRGAPAQDAEARAFGGYLTNGGVSSDEDGDAPAEEEKKTGSGLGGRDQAAQ